MSSLSDAINADRRATNAPAGTRAAAPGNPVPDSLESLSAHKICLMRFVLALSAFFITFIDPSEPTHFVNLTYAALLLYTVYSGLLYLTAVRTGVNPSSRASTWIDIGTYLIIIGLSTGTGSIFFLFFFFSILVASFRDGYDGGLRVTLLSAPLFAAVSFATSAPQELDLNDLLLRPVYLLVIGYMLAVWGGSELTLKRRLALLKSISQSANPRFGVDQTIGAFMESVRKFYDADACLLVTQDQKSSEYILRRADRYKPDRAVRPERIIGEIGCQLASLLGDEVVAVSREARRGVTRRRRVVVGGHEGAPAARWLRVIESVVGLIGDKSFISVPWPQRGGSAARIYVASGERGFDHGDAQFLCQAAEHATPIIENIELLDRLASEAADHERLRISHDLHDSTIQPYIGLKMGLESVCRKAGPDSALAGDLRQLLMKADLSLADLRRYVHDFKRVLRSEADHTLASAVSHYAEQFTRLYGVEVGCEVGGELAASDRLAAEALQIVREGLNNVQRHTTAGRAVVRLLASGGRLVIEVENETAECPRPRAPFVPRSISERAASLGGTTRVAEVAGATIVRVEIPL